MYGPRPGDRVCKVNFSRLNDEEKRHTNLLLAKQDHEIVFEEQGGYYVANVKFVKSPSKSNLDNFTHKSAGAPKSRSPERGASKSPPRDKGKIAAGRSVRPTKPPVPTIGNHSRNGSLERSRGRNPLTQISSTETGVALGSRKMSQPIPESLD